MALFSKQSLLWFMLLAAVIQQSILRPPLCKFFTIQMVIIITSARLAVAVTTVYLILVVEILQLKYMYLCNECFNCCIITPTF